MSFIPIVLERFTFLSKLCSVAVTYYEHPDFGDPSGVEQAFCRLDIKVHCCHHWRLATWKSEDHCSPYWRLYWNRYGGAKVICHDQNHDMDAQQVWVIPPNTPFVSHFDPQGLGEGHRTHISGGPVVEGHERGETIDHLFLHFNLGMPYDLVSDEIFSFSASDDDRSRLKQLVEELDGGRMVVFDVKRSLLIFAILQSFLLRLPRRVWEVLSQDERVEKVIRHIENHLGDTVSNEECAKLVNMATNSFARLFQNELGVSLGQYILKRRMAKACQMLHHTDISIDGIADDVGFCNRHHFSRMFKRVVGESPALYRKGLRVKSSSDVGDL